MHAVDFISFCTPSLRSLMKRTEDFTMWLHMSQTSYVRRCWLKLHLFSFPLCPLLTSLTFNTLFIPLVFTLSAVPLRKFVHIPFSLILRPITQFPLVFWVVLKSVLSHFWLELLHCCSEVLILFPSLPTIILFSIPSPSTLHVSLQRSLSHTVAK